MNLISLDYSKLSSFIKEDEIAEIIHKNKAAITDILNQEKEHSEVLGWIDIDKLADEALLKKIEEKAREIREKAEVFVLIGVGGSNQGARAVIKAVGDRQVEVIYAGNNLSPNYLKKVLEDIKGKSLYVNVIAKNFATLEPGIVFRVIRHYMEETYGLEEAGKRIIATGSLNGSSLELLGKEKGYTLMPFPLDVGGRYSVLSAVGLLPMAVSGVDIRSLLQGARDIKKVIHQQPSESNPAVLYAAIRNTLLSKGFSIEILAFFEPLFEYFSKWWVQLYGESEGKKGRGIFPSACSYSEDLHSLGQYIQEGQRLIFETFLNLGQQGSYIIPHEEGDKDGFQYIDGKDFAYLNKTAYEATVKAHTEGGVPCLILNVPELTAYYLGQLFYFFQYACYLSGSLLGVDPFDQPGVEAYKTNMFYKLRAGI
jgi:glucose-6-phosphate isomerase